MNRAPATLSAAALLALAVFAAPAGRADEPVREFLDGLRDRGLADFALLELDRLAADPGTPPEIAELLPYERALTLLDLAGRAGTGGGGARAKLDEAAALLERFAADAPDSPLAGDAQFLRAEILRRAALDLLAGGDPAELPEETKDRARRLLEDAGRVYAAARRKLEARLREIGPYVDQKDDAARADRSRAEAALIRSRIEAARALVLRAQTYPVGDPARGRLLDEAEGPLEDVRKEYRTKIAVLAGRLLQGELRQARVPTDPEKVAALSEEQKVAARKNLSAAGAIYDEVAGQQVPDGAGRGVRAEMAEKRGLARRLKFAVLNHPLVADHATVVAQATDWLDENRGADPALAAAVLLERGDAYENLDPPEFRKALNDYETAARRSAAVRGLANVAADRVRSELGLVRKDPTNFRDAFDASQTLVRQLGEKEAAVDAADSPDAKADAEAELAAHIEETARLLEAAVNLADARVDPGELGRARYLLAFMNARRGRYYEAAVLAEDVARHFTPVAPDADDPAKNAAAVEAQRGIPLEAASAAALAWTGAYQNRPDGTDGSFELARLRDVADLVAARFPDSGRAGGLRLALGGLLARDGDHAAAADAYAEVPESDDSYANAQVRAGLALRQLHAERTAAGAPAGELNDVRDRAVGFLESGVAATDAKLPADGEAPPSYVEAKVRLATLRNAAGEFAAARDALTKSPRPVVGDGGAINAGVGDGDRPGRGVTSAAFAGFAGFALQQLLRAQIGLRDIPAAKDTIAAVDAVGDGADVGVYVALGRQIESDLAAMPPGPDKTAARENLTEFLDQVAAGDNQTFGSLRWLGETYAGLAAGLPAGSPAASGLYQKSADALRRVIVEAPALLPDPADRPAAVNAVRVRLAEALGGAGDYEQAYAAITEVLEQSPNALNAQTTAADLLARWGADAGDGATLAKALRGDGAAWGWGKLARMLAAQLIGPDRDAYVDRHNAARLRIPQVRQDLAETKAGEERAQELANAERELRAWVTTTDPADIPPDLMRDAEDLYEELQRGRGVANPDPLPTDPAAEAPALAAAGAGADDSTAAADAPAAAVDGEEEDGGPNVGLLAGLIALAALATAGAVWAFRPKKKKRARRRTSGKSAASGSAAAGSAGGTSGKTAAAAGSGVTPGAPAASGGQKAGRAPRRRSGARGAVRSSLPDVAPIPAAAPKAVAAPTGTGFPDFSALPKKNASAAKTRRAKPAPTAASAAASSGKVRRSSAAGSAKAAGAAKPVDGAKRRRSSSSSSGDGSSDRPRKPRPKPDPPAAP